MLYNTLSRTRDSQSCHKAITIDPSKLYKFDVTTFFSAVITILDELAVFSIWAVLTLMAVLAVLAVIILLAVMTVLAVMSILTDLAVLAVMAVLVLAELNN